MKKLLLLTAIAITFVFIQSCEKDDVDLPANETAPQLPPAETFFLPLEFEDYDQIDTNAYYKDPLPTKQNPTSFRNWFYAGANLVAWNVFVGATTAVPAVSFAEAFNHQAEFVGDGVWLWSYDFQVGNDSYTANLTGEMMSGNEVKWVMKISKEGGFTDFTWYSGIVRTDFTKATWTLNFQPENPSPALLIEYEKDSNSEDYFIRYTNIITNDSDNGHYIEFRVQSNELFNRAYDVFRGADNFLQIEWDEPARFGRVKHEKGFDDNEWHCWDEEFRDTDC